MVAHNTLTGAELHESKGADTAAANTVPVSNGAGAAPFQALTWQQMPSGSLIGFSSASTTAQDNTTSAIPLDNTIPQNTEGKQFLSVSYTPKSATSTLIIKVQAYLGTPDSNEQGAITLFKDAETSARATAARAIGSTYVNQISLVYTMIAGTTSSMTFKARFGSNSEGGFAAYLNQSNSSFLFGNTLTSVMTIEEIKA